jgi:ribosomal protein L13
MMPKNNIRRTQYQRLFVFADSDHPYEANILKSYEKEGVESWGSTPKDAAKKEATKK